MLVPVLFCLFGDDLNLDDEESDEEFAEHLMNVHFVPRIGEKVFFDKKEGGSISGVVADVWHEVSIPQVCVYVSIPKDEMAQAFKSFVNED